MRTLSSVSSWLGLAPAHLLPYVKFSLLNHHRLFLHKWYAGEAEQLLLTLHTVPDLDARLRLWAFKADFESMEGEVLEPLQELRAGLAAVRASHTFRLVLAVTREFGNLLNSRQTAGFQLECLTRLAVVRDTATRRPLLDHVAARVAVLQPDPSPSLQSQLAPLVRVARTDYTELRADLASMAAQCAAATQYTEVVQHCHTIHYFTFFTVQNMEQNSCDLNCMCRAWCAGSRPSGRRSPSCATLRPGSCDCRRQKV